MSSHSLSGEIWTLFVAIVASIDHKIAVLRSHYEYRLTWCRIFPLRTVGAFLEWDNQIVLLWFINPNLWRFHLSLWPHWDRIWKVFKSSSTCSLSRPLFHLSETFPICCLEFWSFAWNFMLVCESGCGLTSDLCNIDGRTDESECLWHGKAFHTNPSTNLPPRSQCCLAWFWTAQHFPKENI